jgi:hypothetical protein
MIDVIATSHSQITMTLPLHYNVGDVITISGENKWYVELDTGNIIKDAFPFLFKLPKRATKFVVIKTDNCSTFTINQINYKLT